MPAPYRQTVSRQRLRTESTLADEQLVILHPSLDLDRCGHRNRFSLACTVHYAGSGFSQTEGPWLPHRRPTLNVDRKSEAPGVSVLVAAKDEEENIATCVTSLLRQDYPNLELIAIDDRSSDRTPEILGDLQDRHGSRLRVVTVRSLRKGYYGKTNAMREGMTTATGE